jgi:hypothetical protein
MKNQSTLKHNTDEAIVELYLDLKREENVTNP